MIELTRAIRKDRLRTGKQNPCENSIPVYLLPIVIAAATILGYFSILNVGFLADDFVIVRCIKNGLIIETGQGGVFFRPLTWMTFSIDWFVFDDNPIRFHIVNLVWHFAASLGVAACAQLLIRHKYAGLLAGLIFALHPAHPEAVVWIAGRYDVMSCTLLVWSLYCYLRSHYIDSVRKRVLRILSYALFGFACLSKELAFIYPFVILLYEIIPFPEPDTISRQLYSKIKRILPFFIIGAILFAIRWVRLSGIGGGDYVPEESIDISSSKVLYQTFIQPYFNLFLPINRPLLKPFGLPLIIVTHVILLSPLIFLIRNFNWRLALFCTMGILLFSLPTANMGMLDESFRNSRFLYTPSIFHAILAASLFTFNGRDNRLKRAGTILTVVYIIVLFLLLQQNNHPWREAGRIVHSTYTSAAELIERRAGEWGVTHKKLLAFNIPRTYIGAVALDWGFPEMLQLRHAGELSGVDIEVIHGGIQTQENFNKVDNVIKEGGIVWLYVDRDRELVEYGSIPTVSSKWPK